MRPGFFIPLLLIVACLIPQVQAVHAADVEAFVSPDSSFPALHDFITETRESLTISTYTFSSNDIMDLILEKHGQGVHVEVLIEKSPAGGMSQSQEAVLCNLVLNNITVMLYDGMARYMHAKYLIRDNAAVLVTSENLGTSGFSPDRDYGNRGWGAVVHDPGISEELLEIYSEDKETSIPFACETENHSLSEWDPAGAYKPRFLRETFQNQEVRMIASPNSLGGMLDLIDSANSSIDVQQFYVYPHWGSVKYDTIETAPNPLIEALLDKARDGVRVRILLDSTYYNMDEDGGVNYLTLKYVNSLAANESIPIEAKAVDLDEHGFAKVHNKGMIIDGGVALVSSINWNENSVMRNREIGLVISGEAAGYYARAFEQDWGEGGEEYGLGFLPAMASLAALITVIVYFSRARKGQPIG
jgi:phosphatidylserine/phosphatidylglycerophosphate/cardiolipin synthase-like enzyme